MPTLRFYNSVLMSPLLFQFIYLFILAAPMACGSFQARNRIRYTAVIPWILRPTEPPGNSQFQVLNSISQDSPPNPLPQCSTLWFIHYSSIMERASRSSAIFCLSCLIKCSFLHWVLTLGSITLCLEFSGKWKLWSWYRAGAVIAL